jgi:colanic acid/amylovoran biosynthesis glycosyltransferase
VDLSLVQPNPATIEQPNSMRLKLKKPIRIAYLVSTYPAVSHTFILREIKQLHSSNFEICTASINSPDCSLESMTVEERDEANATFYVKRAGIRGALRAQLALLARSPRAYFSGLIFALRLAGTDFRRLVFALFYFVEATILGRWMESQKIRHLHVHFANAASMVALIASRTFPIEFSLTVHGPDEFYDAPGLRVAEKIAGASFVCCIGQFARSQLMKLSPPSEWKKFEVGPLGVDHTLFAPAAFRPAPEVFEILCVGRLVPAKGQHVLVAAIERLAKLVPNLRLRMVGDGPDRESLSRAIADANLSRYVVLEGSVNQDRIRDFYRRADIFVLASFAEGIPVVLMEAMAMEIPCISTFVAGIPELIRDNIDGILVPPSDDRELADAIKRLIGDPALRRRIGIAARQRVMEKYDLARNVSHLARIFAERIGRSAPGDSKSTVATRVSSNASDPQSAVLTVNPL